jgi:hypothetical protein
MAALRNWLVGLVGAALFLVMPRAVVERVSAVAEDQLRQARLALLIALGRFA